MWMAFVPSSVQDLVCGWQGERGSSGSSGSTAYRVGLQHKRACHAYHRPTCLPNPALSLGIASPMVSQGGWCAEAPEVRTHSFEQPRSALHAAVLVFPGQQHGGGG